MTPETFRYATIMFAAGVGVPVIAALNAQLGARLGSPAAAASVLFVVGFCGAVTAMLATGGAAPLSQVSAQPRHLYLAGLLVAFYILSITWVAPHFGLGNAILFVLLGQLASAAVIDHFGLFGALVRQMTLARAAGFLLMGVGIVLVVRGAR